MSPIVKREREVQNRQRYSPLSWYYWNQSVTSNGGTWTLTHSCSIWTTGSYFQSVDTSNREGNLSSCHCYHPTSKEKGYNVQRGSLQYIQQTLHKITRFKAQGIHKIFFVLSKGAFFSHSKNTVQSLIYSVFLSWKKLTEKKNFIWNAVGFDLLISL